MIKPIDEETVKSMTVKELNEIMRKNRMSQSDSWGYLDHQASIISTEINRRAQTSKGI